MFILQIFGAIGDLPRLRPRLADQAARPVLGPQPPTPREALIARIREAQAEVDSYSGVGHGFMRFIERIGGQEQDLNDIYRGAQSNLQRLQRQLAALDN